MLADQDELEEDEEPKAAHAPSIDVGYTFDDEN